ncbi:MAG: hypothetical protein LBT11_00885 [Treponema sp.]|jgi:hypothetical protein|nr:hypothetical protein [Treponema sp.]
MKKSMALLFTLMAAGLFAQTEPETRHQPYDMLLGLNLGLGGMLSGAVLQETGDPGYVSLYGDIGLSYEFYVFDKLSLSIGLMVHPEVYYIVAQSIPRNFNASDYMATPLCLTIPVMVYVNFPPLDWLYAGMGLSVNIPVYSFTEPGLPAYDTRGPVFMALPMDLGFDLINPGEGGMRFFFRLTLSVHKGGVLAPLGFIWQIYNWKLN